MPVRWKLPALSEGLLILIPLVMTVARRTSTLLMALTALAALIVHRRSLRDIWRQARPDAAILAGLVLLVAYGLISLAWSPLPGRGLKQLVFDFALPVGAGLILLMAPAPAPPRNTLRLLLISLGIASALVVAQIYFRVRLESIFSPLHGAPEPWRFNMVMVTFGLLLPVLILSFRRMPLIAGLTFLALVAAVLMSKSASAKTSLIAGILAYAFFYFMPRRWSLAFAGLALATLLAIQPWQGQLVERGVAATGQMRLLFISAKERIVIWKASGLVTLDAMPWGTGMGSSDLVSERPFAKTLERPIWIGLRQTHPHDAFLHVMMELGLPGLVAMVLIGFGVLRTMARLPDTLYPPAMALAIQIVTVDLISHGAWQAWWFTAIMLGIIALKRFQIESDQA